MSNISRCGWALFILILFAPPAMAQNNNTSCRDIVQEALTTVDRLCGETGRNQACYGNPLLEVEPQPDTAAFSFEHLGDLADVAAIRALRSGGMDISHSEWGIALLRLQANLPDTLPGENVTLLLLGNVEIQNAVTAEQKQFNPMQAFFIRNYLDSMACEEMPNSGVLIQTPEGAQEITLTVNAVDIHLGSTAYVQAQPDDELRVNVLEGHGRVAVQGVEQTALSGMRVRIPLDDQLKASGPPSPPEMCDEADLRNLPLEHASCSAFELTLGDTPCPATIPFGMKVKIYQGSGYKTEAEAVAGLREANTSITINGQSVAVVRLGVYPPTGTYPWNFDTIHDWGTPPPGKYTLVGNEPHGTYICDVTILEKPGQ